MLKLKDMPVEVVSNYPAVIIIADKLFFIDKIDAKKLKPFLIRDRVLIPKEAEKKYLSSFVVSCLRDFDAKIDGIEVREIEALKKAELVLELGLKGSPVWILEFHYMKQVIHADSPIRRFVSLYQAWKVAWLRKFYA